MVFPHALMSAMWNNVASGSAFEQATIDSFEAPVTMVVDGSTDTSFEDFGTDIIDSASDDTFIALTGPSGTLADVADDSDKATMNDQTIYVVRSGDTVSSIASLFDLKSETIKNANNLTQGVKVGQTLIIPPGDGVMYTIAKGDSIRSIAGKFKVASQDIMDFNYILEASSIRVGQKIFIPGGKALPVVTPTKSGKGKSSGGAKLSFNGTFIKPTSGPMTSHFGMRHGKPHEGVDFGVRVGTPIYATASGIVQARSGYNGGYGNLIVIKHGQGVESRYAHLSSISVATGTHVNQGDIIGYSGNTGRSTGPHLHFEIRQNGRAVNPANYLK